MGEVHQLDSLVEAMKGQLLQDGQLEQRAEVVWEQHEQAVQLEQAVPGGWHLAGEQKKARAWRRAPRLPEAVAWLAEGNRLSNDPSRLGHRACTFSCGETVRKRWSGHESRGTCHHEGRRQYLEVCGKAVISAYQPSTWHPQQEQRELLKSGRPSISTV